MPSHSQGHAPLCHEEQLHKKVVAAVSSLDCACMAASRYRLFYEQVVRTDLMHKMQYKNFHMIPTLKAVHVSGATHAVLGKGLDHPVASAFMLELITGQQARLTHVKKANARYKVREGFLEGSKVTLHRDQMWNFMDRLVTLVLPRITDFGGLKHGAFDGNGNYAIGIEDIHIFPEIEAQHGNMLNFNLGSARGCGIHIETTTQSDAEAKLLLSGLRVPFAPQKKATQLPPAYR